MKGLSGGIVGTMGLALLLLTVQGCGASSTAWVKDGQKVGRIWKHKMPYGAEYRYLDVSKRLMMIERKDKANALIAGACTIKYEYGESNRLAAESCYDASGNPELCAAGYASKRYTYSSGPASNLTEERTLCDKQGLPACGTDGYAYAKLVFTGSDLKQVFLQDAQRKPAAASWDGVAGTAKVEYAKLQGVGTVRCAVYFRPSGEIIERKVLSGTSYWRGL